MTVIVAGCLLHVWIIGPVLWIMQGVNQIEGEK